MTTQGNYDRARPLLEDALAGARQVGDANAVAWTLYLLGNLVWLQTDDPRLAQPLYQEALALSIEVRDLTLHALVLLMLGHVAQAQADYQSSVGYFAESIGVWQDFRAVRWATWASGHRLAGLGALARSRGKVEQAARLLGAACEVLQGADLQIMPRADLDLAKRQVDREVARVRAHLGDEVFTGAFAEGCAMTAAEALAYAQQD